jgi:hypothetical protein
MKTPTKTILSTSLICFCLLITLSARAQFSVGARAGANLATEEPADYYHVFLARPYAGIFAQYQLGSPVSLQLGLNYSGEGVNLKDLSTNDIYHARQSYLTVPFLIQYKFAFGGYIEAGPQVGFLLSANEKFNSEASVDTKDFYKSTEFSGGLGLGYEISQGSLTGFGINVRYMRGISAINKTDAGDENVKNRVLSIGLTYRLISPESGNKK